MFSVVIPTLNEEKFLPALLESLAVQKYRDFEVIVADGGSTDNTVALAQRFAPKLPNLRVVPDLPAGIARQRNLGAQRAKGEWLLFIDADSVLLPYAFERIALFITRKKPKIFTTWFSPDSEVINEAMVTLFLNMFFEGAQLLGRPVTQGTFAAIRRDVFEKAGGYNAEFAFGEDYDLTKRICQSGVKLAMLRETLYVYSLRRYRLQGTLRSFQSYIRAVFSVLIINRTPKTMSGYELGGLLYTKKRKSERPSTMDTLTGKIRDILKEFLE